MERAIRTSDAIARAATVQQRPIERTPDRSLGLEL